MNHDTEPEGADEPGDTLALAIAAQHRRIRELMAEVLAATAIHRERAFHALRRYLAAHEATEQVLLHGRLAPDDGAYVRGRADEKEIVGVLRDLERSGVMHAVFPERFEALAQLVRRQVDAEERDELPRCLAGLPQLVAWQMAGALARVGERAAELAREDYDRSWSFSGMLQLSRYRLRSELGALISQG